MVTVDFLIPKMPGKWVRLTPAPTQRSYVATFAGPNGKISVTGGDGCAAGTCGVLALVETYDPSTETWGRASPLPETANSHGTVLGPDGRMDVLVYQRMCVYSTNTRTWTRVANAPARVTGAVAIAAGNAHTRATPAAQYDPRANSGLPCRPYETPTALSSCGWWVPVHGSTPWWGSATSSSMPRPPGPMRREHPLGGQGPTYTPPRRTNGRVPRRQWACLGACLGPALQSELARIGASWNARRVSRPMPADYHDGKGGGIAAGADGRIYRATAQRYPATGLLLAAVIPAR